MTIAMAMMETTAFDSASASLTGTSSTQTIVEAKVVTISYQELKEFNNNNENNELIQRIGFAFGSNPECLGLIAVEGVPNFQPMRERLLQMAPRVAQLPNLEQTCVRPDTLYSVGWSHGKEQLAQGQPDLAKGSYYANPLTPDLVKSLVEREPQKAEHWKQQGQRKPECYAPNVWPSEDDLPGLEAAFCGLGKTMHETGIMLATVCDAYCRLQANIELGLETTLRQSMNAKGRLLHYFPMPQQQQSQESGQETVEWCGWHNDHGSLTALAPGMYLDPTTGTPVDNPDPAHAGLYIRARSGQTLRASLPPHACGFQIGETSQIQSGGLLQATPHAVRPPRRAQVSRESFALFMEPEFEQALDAPPGKSVQDCQGEASQLPRSVLPLGQRWKPGDSFGDFHTATVSGFANHDSDKKSA